MSFIKAWCVEKTTQRLAIALGISLLLHWWMMAQPMLVTDQRASPEPWTLQAKLIASPPALKAHSPSASTSKPAPAPIPSKPDVAPAMQLPEMTTVVAPVVDAVLPPETPASDKTDTGDGEVSSNADTVEENVATAAVLSEAEAEAVKPTVYTRIQTEFDVLMRGQASPVGTATIHFQRDETAQYSLRWEVKASGLLGLLYPNLLQTSEGKITEYGLQPQFYRYRFGDRASKSYEAEFNWSEKVISLKTAKQQKYADITDNAQDLLSFMYQFMYVPPLETMQLQLTNGKKVAVYDYAFQGEETLSLAWGDVNTYHILHSKTEVDEKTELWLAVDYQFIPVKIRKTEKNGTVIEQVATRIIAE